MIRQRTRLDCGVCALAMLLGLTYEAALAALTEERRRNPESIPDPREGNSTHDLWSAAMHLGAFVVYVSAERFDEDPPIGPETTDGVYSLEGPTVYSGGHFVHVAGGLCHDPFDGSVTPWAEYAARLGVRVRSVLYAR